MSTAAEAAESLSYEFESHNLIWYMFLTEDHL